VAQHPAELGHLTWNITSKRRLSASRCKRVNADESQRARFRVCGTMLRCRSRSWPQRAKIAWRARRPRSISIFRHGRHGFLSTIGRRAARGAIGKGLMPGAISRPCLAPAARRPRLSYVIKQLSEGSAEASTLLYWNADSTNLPGPMSAVRAPHLSRNACSSREDGGLGGRWIGKITVPAYVVATARHIVPCARLSHEPAAWGRRASCLERAGTSPE